MCLCPPGHPQPVERDYVNKAGADRGRLRTALTDALVSITENPHARMYWSPERFRREVFVRFRLKLVGWPPHIPFGNLSNSSGPSSAQIRELNGLWARGELFFDTATPEEVAHARKSLSKAIPGPLFQAPAPTYVRRDMGKRRKPYTRHVREGPKSAKIVEDEVDRAAGSGEHGRNKLMMCKGGARLIWHKGVWRELGQGELSDDPISDYSDDEL